MFSHLLLDLSEVQDNMFYVDLLCRKDYFSDEKEPVPSLEG
jgi:hypothetical protein